MNRFDRTLVALAVTALLAVFGGAVQGVATVRGTVEPGTPAAEALERLRRDAGRAPGTDGPPAKPAHREGRHVTAAGADAPWLADRAS